MAVDSSGQPTSVTITIVVPECDTGARRECGPNVDAYYPDSICTKADQTCFNNKWPLCAARGPAVESCNKRDDDCDGEVDENLTKLTNNQQGLCYNNSQTCINGFFRDDPENYKKIADTCNGKDDDCNSTTPDGSGQIAPKNANQTTICKNSVQSCTNGAWTNNYTAVSGYQQTETSCNDGKDNDCDGLPDCDDPNCVHNSACCSTDGLCDGDCPTGCNSTQDPDCGSAGCCGDGTIGAGEDCEGTELKGETCKKIDTNFKDTLDLSCDPISCKFDTSSCKSCMPTEICGNKDVNGNLVDDNCKDGIDENCVKANITIEDTSSSDDAFRVCIDDTSICDDGDRCFKEQNLAECNRLYIECRDSDACAQTEVGSASQVLMNNLAIGKHTMKIVFYRDKAGRSDRWSGYAQATMGIKYDGNVTPSNESCASDGCWDCDPYNNGRICPDKAICINTRGVNSCQNPRNWGPKIGAWMTVDLDVK